MRLSLAGFAARAVLLTRQRSLSARLARPIRPLRGLWMAGLLVAFGMVVPAHAQQPNPSYQYNPNALQPQGQPQGERFYLTVPDQWKEAIRTRQQGADVIAYIPPEQTKHQWTDMLTIQVFQGMAALPAQTFYERTNASYKQSCATTRAGELQTGLSNGYPSAFWVLACGQSANHGHGETSFFRLVQGDNALYIVQRAWRMPPYNAQQTNPLTAEASQAAVTVLQSFGVCDPGLPDHPCP